MNSFNDAAADKRQTGPTLLECIARTRDNLDLAAAAERGDWAEAARLCTAGADIMHREQNAMRALTKSDDSAVADILEGKRSPIYGTPMLAYTLVRAAEKGNLDTIAHIIAKKPSADILNQGICTALLSKQDAAADMLLKALPEVELTDNALVGMLVARPAEYERLTAASERAPDYLMHFINACHLKEKPAIDRALDKMLAHREQVRRNIEWADMDFMDRNGSALHEMTAYVFGSGHLPAIDKFIDAFSGSLMPDFILLHVALSVSADEKEVFPHIVEKIGIKPDMVSILLLHGNVEDRRPAARFLIDFVPDAAKEANYPLLRVFAEGDTPQEFFDALAKGIPLPQDERDLVKLWEAATEAKNDKIAAHIETAIGAFSPAQIAELQKSGSADIMLKAARLSGDWHARAEALYWHAAVDGRQDILAAMPKDEKLLAAFPFQVEIALSKALERGDDALVKDIIARTPWDDGCREKAADFLLGAPQWLPLLDEIGYAPRPLTERDAHSLVRGGAEFIRALLARGFEMDEKAGIAVLEIAARQNARETAEYMLEKGLRMEDAQRLPTLIDAYADKDTLALLEKWLRRDEVHPAPGLGARLSETAPDKLLGLGVEAAYADRFGDVMQKIADGAASAFDPDALCRAKDAGGNSILDILGAHGRLNDILVPALWRDKDAVTFIRDHAAPCYHGQCDFNGLKAALDQLRLKEMGKRTRLGLKGP